MPPARSAKFLPIFCRPGLARVSLVILWFLCLLSRNLNKRRDTVAPRYGRLSTALYEYLGSLVPLRPYSLGQHGRLLHHTLSLLRQ